AANLVVCSLKRLPSTLKVVRTPGPNPNAARFDTMFSRASVKPEESFDISLENAGQAASLYLGPRFSRIRSQALEKGQGILIAAEKGRWTRLGAYIIHAGFLLVLAGGLAGAHWGYSGSIRLEPGQSTNLVRTNGGEQIKKLPFTLACNDFAVTFWEDGTPREYRSFVTVFDEDGESFEQVIRVNHPLRHKGVSLYQSTYGQASPETVNLVFTERTEPGQDPGGQTAFTVKMREQHPLPDGSGTFAIHGFNHNYTMGGRSAGPAILVIVEYAQEERPAQERIILLRHPRFDAMQRDKYIISATDYVPRYYTGLQVTRDPGVATVYAGFIFLMAGCLVALLLSHKQLWVKLDRQGDKTRIRVVGNTNKNAYVYERHAKRIANNLFDKMRAMEK
ncbi:MAG: cytochrome c biogenesis protein ResB, partial [Desulfatibacillaceae bacterium]|nr:cytochrome c biogenesis protein ResB [Desulfatibacillaceae bacterium]